MCGIAGFCNLKADPKQNIERMLDSIIHRGPDAYGIWSDPCDKSITFGHRRLAIMDLSENGLQPMVSHSRRYVICYNGEIYNHCSLLEKMKTDGYTDSMHGTSDTEILLEAIDMYGIEEAIRFAKGMFAIALYDRQEETLTLVRDRIGEKPLYYGIVNGAFAFASEINAFKCMDGFDNAINADVLGIYLTHGYIPAPYSIYKRIWKLEPGTLLKIKCRINNRANGQVANDSIDSELAQYSPKYKTYWSVTEKAVYGQSHMFTGSREEAADELEKLLVDSIRNQMISDVPLGAFLSAGIDSTTVVSLMQSISDKPIRSFTIGFEEKAYDESDAARAIARHIGTEHTELFATKQDALDVVALLPGVFGEPFADSSQIPTFLVSKLTREHVTVSLSGDGGDELFGGYRSYVGVENIWNKIHKIPYPLRSLVGKTMEILPVSGNRGTAIHAHGTLMGATSPSNLYRRTYETIQLTHKLLNKDLSETSNSLPYKYTEVDETIMSDPYHASMLMDMTMYHPDDILVKVDRTAMAVSLESRVPMLDRDVVEFAWTLPTDYLRNGNVGKMILRDVLYRHVPKELMDRPKKGFSVPVEEWLRNSELMTWADELLNVELIKHCDVLDKRYVNQLWTDYIERGIWRSQVWNVLVLLGWFRENRK